MKSKENSRVVRSWSDRASQLPEVSPCLVRQASEGRSPSLPFDDAKIVKIFRLRKYFEKFFYEKYAGNAMSPVWCNEIPKYLEISLLVYRLTAE